MRAVADLSMNSGASEPVWVWAPGLARVRAQVPEQARVQALERVPQPASGSRLVTEKEPQASDCSSRYKKARRSPLHQQSVPRGVSCPSFESACRAAQPAGLLPQLVNRKRTLSVRPARDFDSRPHGN